MSVQTPTTTGAETQVESTDRPLTEATSAIEGVRNAESTGGTVSLWVRSGTAATAVCERLNDQFAAPVTYRVAKTRSVGRTRKIILKPQ